jgi:hypothetical protein
MSASVSTTGLPEVLRAIICDYAAVWTLLDWINEGDLSWEGIAKNPNGIDMMLDNKTQAHWGQLSRNPNGFYLLRDELPMLISWDQLMDNPNPAAIAYAIENIGECKAHEVDHLLSRSPHAIEWLIAHPEWIDHRQLCMNPDPRARELLIAHPEWIDNDCLCWNPSQWAMDMVKPLDDALTFGLSSNPYARDLLLRYKEIWQTEWYRMSWRELCKNPSSWGVEMALTQPEKINWYNFSANPFAFDWLEAHREKIDWPGFSANPRIFEPTWREGLAEIL